MQRIRGRLQLTSTDRSSWTDRAAPRRAREGRAPFKRSDEAHHRQARLQSPAGLECFGGPATSTRLPRLRPTPGVALEGTTSAVADDLRAIAREVRCAGHGRGGKRRASARRTKEVPTSGARSRARREMAERTRRRTGEHRGGPELRLRWVARPSGAAVKNATGQNPDGDQEHPRARRRAKTASIVQDEPIDTRRARTIDGDATTHAHGFHRTF